MIGRALSMSADEDITRRRAAAAAMAMAAAAVYCLSKVGLFASQVAFLVPQSPRRMLQGAASAKPPTLLSLSLYIYT